MNKSTPFKRWSKIKKPKYAWAQESTGDDWIILFLTDSDAYKMMHDADIRFKMSVTEMIIEGDVLYLEGNEGSDVTKSMCFSLINSTVRAGINGNTVIHLLAPGA
jgi:hypothetical protein